MTKKLSFLPPIVRHFDVVPGSLVCDVMLRAVPNGDVIVYGNVRSTVMWGLGQHTLMGIVLLLVYVGPRATHVNPGIIDLKWGLQQRAFFSLWGICGLMSR
jgi:hypothetical protein